MNMSDYEYHCSAGETFDSVALSVYGSEKYASELLEANPLLSAVPVFTGGETLALPVVELPEEDDEDDDEDEIMPATAPWKE